MGDAEASIRSILLPFSGGKRLSLDWKTVLLSDYVEGATGGAWEEFTWSMDDYGE